MPPLADRVVLFPEQIVLVPEILGLGAGVTVTVWLVEAAQPLLPVAVTLKVVVWVGETVIDVEVAPVLHT